MCAASRSMRRPTNSAESTMNSGTSFAADPVTTNTFLQPGDAVTFSTTHASRSASCRLHDQKIHGARHDKTRLSGLAGQVGRGRFLPASALSNLAGLGGG